MGSKLTIENTESISSDDINKSDESGLAVEAVDSQEEISHPFDPEAIKIRTVPILAAQLVSRIEYGGLNLTPDFQRLRGIWDEKRKSRLIESLLLRIPIPVFYVAADKNDDWSVVDGLQRMSTINGYVTGEFSLRQLEYLTWLDGQKHSELPRALQRRISETQLIVNIIEPGTPPEVMFNVFVRINTGGMTLNNQELRHALHPGPVRELLADLAGSEEFRQATNGSIAPIRMADRECVLRFLAFYLNRPEDYNARDLDSFLGKVMDTINDMTPAERGHLIGEFKKAMRAAFTIFGSDAFRKRYDGRDNRRPISKALFEVWSVHLAYCSPDQIEQLVIHQKSLRYRFRQLMNEDDEFNAAISYTTSSPQRIQKRFKAIGKLVQESL